MRSSYKNYPTNPLEGTSLHPKSPVRLARGGFGVEMRGAPWAAWPALLVTLLAMALDLVAGCGWF